MSGVVIMLITSLDEIYTSGIISLSRVGYKAIMTQWLRDSSRHLWYRCTLKRCVIVAGPRKKGVLMMHGLVKEPSVVHLGEGLGSVVLANQ